MAVRRRRIRLGIMAAGFCLGCLVQSFDIMDEGHVAGDIGPPRGKVAGTEVPLALQVGEMRVQAFADGLLDECAKLAV